MPSGTLPDIPDEQSGDTTGMPNIPAPVDRQRLQRRRQQPPSPQPLPVPKSTANNDQVETPRRPPCSTNSSSSGE